MRALPAWSVGLAESPAEPYLCRVSRQARIAKDIGRFPQRSPFATVEQIEEYLGGDRVACLLCGKELLELGAHLHYKHGTTCEEYRAEFGLRAGDALAGRAVREKISAKAKLRFQKGAPPSWFSRCLDGAKKRREQEATGKAKRYMSPVTARRLSERSERARGAEGGLNEIIALRGQQAETICSDCGVPFLAPAVAVRTRRKQGVRCGECQKKKLRLREHHRAHPDHEPEYRDVPCSVCGMPVNACVLCDTTFVRCAADKRRPPSRCGRGHELHGNTLYVKPSGKWSCRLCQKDQPSFGR